MSAPGIDWKRRADWLDSLTPLAAVESRDSAQPRGRVHTYTGMNPERAAQKLARILAAEDLQATTPVASAARSIPSAQQIAKPYDPYAPGGEQGPIPVRTPQPDGETPPNAVAPTPAPPRRQPSETDAPTNSAPAGTGPTVFEQLYDPDSTAGTPGTQMTPFIPTPVATPPPVPVNPDPIHPPDLTGRQVGDSWTEDWFDGYTRRFSIPEGNGLNTVDIVIVDAEGKVVTTARVAKAAEGPGYLRWQSDARGNSTYFETPDPARGGYGQHFGAGVSTSGAPTAEFQVGPDWATVVTPSYDADGNLVGYDVGTRNEQGLYDNEHTDSLGYRTLTTTGRDAQGRLTSEFVGQLGPDGRGWVLDEHGLPAERFLDGNGRPVVISTDPTTRHRTVLFDGGLNVFDSDDNLIGQFAVGSDGRILSGWSKHAWYSIERTEYHRDPFGLLREEIVDPVRGIRGQIRYLGEHTKVSYDDGSVVIFDRDGRIVDTRGFGDKALAAVRNFGRGAKNNALAMLEGIGALSGFNDQFNTTAEWLGYEPNLATQAEAGEGLVLGIGGMLAADITAVVGTAWGTYKSLTGEQSWSKTWDDAWHGALNSYNEKSKFLLGTDWAKFAENPAETLGSATVGIAALLLPTRGVSKGAAPKLKPAPRKPTGLRMPIGMRLSPASTVTVDRVSGSAIPNLARSGYTRIKQMPQQLLNRADDLILSAADLLYELVAATKGHGALAGYPVHSANFSWDAARFSMATPSGGRGNGGLHRDPTAGVPMASRPERRSGPMLRGGDLEGRVIEQIRPSKARKGVKPGDVESLLRNLAEHPAGEEMARLISDGRLSNAENYYDVVRDLASSKKELSTGARVMDESAVAAAVEELRFASALHDRGYVGIKFSVKAGQEVKPGVVAGPRTDIDVVALDANGRAHAYQLKTVHNVDSIVATVKNKMRQLKNSNADVNTFVIDTPWALSDGQLKILADELGNLYGVGHNEIQVVVRSGNRKTVRIPPDGEFLLGEGML